MTIMVHYAINRQLNQVTFPKTLTLAPSLYAEDIIACCTLGRRQRFYQCYRFLLFRHYFYEVPSGAVPTSIN